MLKRRESVPFAEYDEYAARIRREYAHVPEPAFRQGRRAVLESFLHRPCLYFTGPLKEAWEPRARANLKREIASLSA